MPSSRPMTCTTPTCPPSRPPSQKAHAQSVMGAYSSLYGVPANASDLLLKQNLRDKWGFDGYVVSDCGAIGDIFYNHHYAKSMEEAVGRRRQSRLRPRLRRRIQRPAQRRQAGLDHRGRDRQVGQAAVHGPDAAGHVRSARAGRLRANSRERDRQPGPPAVGIAGGPRIHCPAQEPESTACRCRSPSSRWP